MRAICEACAAPQPLDWKAGDLCVACGAAVRREARCFWCNQWSPAGKFCRGCGAEMVDDAHFGAARMLKRAGSGMLDVPRQLRELEPERLEVFASQYARQRGVALRHVDDVRLIERHLKYGGYADDLEDELLGALPWDDVVMAAMQPPPRPAGDELALMRALESESPIELVRRLATVARLWLGDWGVLREVRRSAYAQLAHESALALTWWRAVTASGLEPEDELLDLVATSPLRAQAAVRLAYFGREVDPAALAEARASGDPDLAFAAALCTGDVTRLREALRGDIEEQVAAAVKLVELGELRELTSWLATAPAEAQAAAVQAIGRAEGDTAPMHDALLSLMATTEDQATRSRCGIILGRAAPASRAARIAELGGGDIYVQQALLSPEAGRDPATLAAVGAVMVERGWFRMSQYGLAEAAQRGAFPEDFVLRVFERADAETRKELCRFAERQLLGGVGETPRRFLMRTLFDDHPAELRSAAYWGLRRATAQGAPSADPFVLDPVPIARFFESTGDFVRRLTALLNDHASLREVGVYDFLAELLRGMTDDGAAALASEGPASRALVDALLAALDLKVWALLETAILQALIKLGQHPELRGPIQEALPKLRGRGGDFDYWVQRGIEELAAAPPISGILG